jgi:hypothetical protein
MRAASDFITASRFSTWQSWSVNLLKVTTLLNDEGHPEAAILLGTNLKNTTLLNESVVD